MFKPCIDIHNGVVKQIVGSSLIDIADNNNNVNNNKDFVKENFVSSLPPAHYADLYRERRLLGGHVIMLGSGEENERAAIDALRAYEGGLQLGGGVNAENAELWLERGASHVIVTSYVFKDGVLDMSKLQKMVDAVGKEKLVLDLSCRKKKKKKNNDDNNDNVDDNYYVVTDRWQKFTSLAVTKETLIHLANYCCEFLVHGVDVEGLKCGIEVDLVKKLGDWSPIPVTYAGGVRNLEDLELVRKVGNNKVDITVGSALDIFGGDLSFDKVVEWHHQYHQQ